MYLLSLTCNDIHKYGKHFTELLHRINLNFWFVKNHQRNLTVFFCFSTFKDALKRGENDGADMHLYWDSWDRHHPLKAGLSPRTGRSRATRASVPSEESLGLNNNNRGGSAIPPSSSVSSISSLNTQCVLGPPLTPPPSRGKGNDSSSVTVSDLR